MFFTLIVQPMINFLTAIHGILPQIDFGIAIIILTILIRLILFPLNWKSIKIQKKMSIVQEKMNQIKNTVKDQEQQAMQIMNLYKTEKVNPFSSCLPLILQLIVLIGLINVLNGYMAGQIKINGQMQPLENAIYKNISFIKKDYVYFNKTAFGFLDLTQKAIAKDKTTNATIYNIYGIILAIMSGILQYIQTKMITPKKIPSVEGTKEDNITNAMNAQMLYILPIMTIWIGLSFPMGLTLYWIISSILSIIQQAIALKSSDNNKQDRENKIIDIQKSN
ncbi:MAG TPA: YidC/Oxa1 family membrane protein insertase [bacterium]|jgi:YidC/Oxa1 family membrane protein insertase|nr:YidC/Oxa1 family membrane protein insertase [bacterium]